jgi:hypothetical protein
VILPRREALAALISEARDRGELRADLDVAVALDMLTGPVILRRLFGSLLPSDPDWEEKMVEALLEGWRSGD